MCPLARPIAAEVASRGRFALLSFAASRLRVRFLPRGSGRGEPDPGIDPVAGVLWVILKLVKIFVLHPTEPAAPHGLDLANVATYAESVVEQPIINVEERIDRFVGRRTKAPDALSVAGSTKADSIAWRKAVGGVRIPRGIHRFKTHAEADQWLWRMIARPTN